MIVPPAAEGDTVAVRVNLEPAVGVVVEEANVVVVAVNDEAATDTETALDVLVAYVDDPL